MCEMCAHVFDCNFSYENNANHANTSVCEPTEMKEKIGAKIRRLRNERGLTQEALAKAVGVSRVAVTKWESGDSKNLKHENLVALSKALGSGINFLLDVDTNTEDFTDDLIFARSAILDKNTLPGPELHGEIPLISWVQAGMFCESPDLFHPGDAEQWIPSIRRFGKHTYALRIHGDSMVSENPAEKSYPPGTIIFVDPEKPVTNGCKVVARVAGTDEATFKKYSEDCGKRYLRPLNKMYETIVMDETMHICGVVVGSWIDE